MRSAVTGFARTIAAILVSILASTTLTQCSFGSDPPAGLVASADSYAADIGSIAGVSKAEVEVRSVHPIWHPDDWIIQLAVTVTGARDLESVPAAVSSVASPSGAQLAITMTVPAGAGASKLTLTDVSSDAVTRAGLLRALPFVNSTTVGRRNDSVSLVAGVTLNTAVGGIRSSGALAAGGLGTVVVRWSQGDSAEVSLLGPSPDLVAALDRLSSDTSVSRIRATEPSTQISRPTLVVDTSRPASVAADLYGIDTAPQSGRPRTAFTVRSGDDGIDGYVGLPMGSPEPDDLDAGVPTPSPSEESVFGEELRDSSAAVSAFLGDTFRLAQVDSELDVHETECASSAGGTRIEGRILLPVFAVSDSADPAFDAIVASWESSGFVHSDQALGTMFFSSDETDARVVEASIRGTADGIRISAWSRCLR